MTPRTARQHDAGDGHTEHVALLAAVLRRAVLDADDTQRPKLAEEATQFLAGFAPEVLAMAATSKVRWKRTMN
jgi:hypothetical protein